MRISLEFNLFVIQLTFYIQFHPEMEIICKAVSSVMAATLESFIFINLSFEFSFH